MTNFLKKGLVWVLLVVGSALCAFLLLHFTWSPANSRLQQATSTAQSATKEVIHFVAIGDSLTEGVGDQTGAGGYVPLVAKELQNKFQLNGIEVDNYGKAGDRSDQILKRLKESTDIQQGIASADLLSLTVGGNDLMKVIKGDIFELTEASFEQPMKTYQKQLRQLIEAMREQNTQAPLYIMGIYNPFYLNFPEFTEMQTIVDQWNEKTKAVVAEYENVYFIPINDLLYKGTTGEVGIVSEGDTTQNDLLYEADHFHPNNLGYQIMANAFYNEMVRTKAAWLPEGVTTSDTN